MNFYRRRPLTLIISLCMLISALTALLSGSAKLILIAACSLAALFLILLFERCGIKTFCNLPAVPFVVIATVLIICTLLISFAYYNIYAARYDSLDTGHIRATVVEVESSTAYSAIYVVRLDSCGGKQSFAKGLLCTETALALSLGDVIEADVDFCRLEEFHEGYDTPRLELLSDGYIFTCQTIGTVGLIGQKSTPEIWFTKLRECFSAKMSLYLSDDASAFADALLLGRRDGLGRIYRDFNYIGVIHLLALSGLHIAILSGGLSKALERAGIGQRLQNAAIFFFLIFYVTLTGFLMSVVRAALMLMITFAATVINSDADRVTALFVACGLIVFASPAAVFDVSLQLSFFATLGVLLMSDAAAKRSAKILNKHHRAHPIFRHLSKLISSIVTSLGATMFILPLQWLYFGEVSLLSVPATLIMSVLCEALLLILPIHLIFSLVGLHFICGRIGFILTVLTKLCADTAEWLASFSWVVSLNYPFSLPIILITICVIVWMMAKDFSSWLYALIPLGVASTIFLFGVMVYNNICSQQVTLDYISGTSGDIIAAVSQRAAMITDVSQGSQDLMYVARTRVFERCITEVDTLLLTHIHRRHVSAVRSLLKNRIVHRILIPLPSGEYDEYILDDLCELAEEYGAAVILYSPTVETTLTFADLSVTIPALTKTSRSTQPLTALRMSSHGTELSYVGTCAWESDYVWSFTSDAKYLLFGTYGPNIQDSPSIDFSDTTDVVCISSETLGHRLSSSLDTFDGTIICNGELLISIEP